jgi:hypothetical protein
MGSIRKAALMPMVIFVEYYSNSMPKKIEEIKRAVSMVEKM